MQSINFKYYLKYFFAIVNIKVHHLAQRVENLDAKFFLFILQQSFGVFNQPADESANVALFTCPVGKGIPVDKGHRHSTMTEDSGLNKRMKLSL